MEKKSGFGFARKCKENSYKKQGLQSADVEKREDH